jgi:hypothetical protein
MFVVGSVTELALNTEAVYCLFRNVNIFCLTHRRNCLWNWCFFFRNNLSLAILKVFLQFSFPLYMYNYFLIYVYLIPYFLYKSPLFNLFLHLLFLHFLNFTPLISVCLLNSISFISYVYPTALFLFVPLLIFLSPTFLHSFHCSVAFHPSSVFFLFSIVS